MFDPERLVEECLAVQEKGDVQSAIREILARDAMRGKIGADGVALHRAILAPRLRVVSVGRLLAG